MSGEKTDTANKTYIKWNDILKGTPDGVILERMDPDEIEDAFSGNISFGTGGLRGVMGLGTNRLNRYTVERVTHGLAKTILSDEPSKSAGIAYDTRHNSKEFAQIVAGLLSAYGISVYIFNKPMPTPALSFAVQYLKLGWGVCITASHNPQEYNGYKVYDCYGVQVTDALAAKITGEIDNIEYFEPTPKGQTAAVKTVENEVVEAYFKEILNYINPVSATGTGLRASRTVPLDVNSSGSAASYPFVYSALHGAGANAVPAVLEKLGFKPICVEQSPDGAFGGLKTPNPEEPVVYENALKTAKIVDAKLLLATDPDCDRVGVMVKSNDRFVLLDGNQIGALLIDYLATVKGVSKGDTVISTIVSGLLGEMIAKDHGLDFVRLLTGFKYIGEHIVRLPKNRQFFFGYEESYGYLAGDGAKDKDAVIASALIVKMAEYYDSKGKTLVDRFMELCEKHGYCVESLFSANVPQRKQKEIMKQLRSTAAIDNMMRSEDHLHGLNGLPPADVFKLYFTDNTNNSYIKAWAAVRPSGTEPKLKLYTGVHAKTQKAAEQALKSLTKKMTALLGV